MNNTTVYMRGFLSAYLYISIYKHAHTMCKTVILTKMPVPVIMVLSVAELHTENIFVSFKFFIFQTSEISICSIYHKPAMYHNKSGNELLMTNLCSSCGMSTCHTLVTLRSVVYTIYLSEGIHALIRDMQFGSLSKEAPVDAYLLSPWVKQAF